MAAVNFFFSYVHVHPHICGGGVTEAAPFAGAVNQRSIDNGMSVVVSSGQMAKDML